MHHLVKLRVVVTAYVDERMHYEADGLKEFDLAHSTDYGWTLERLAGSCFDRLVRRINNWPFLSRTRAEHFPQVVVDLDYREGSRFWAVEHKLASRPLAYLADVKPAVLKGVRELLVKLVSDVASLKKPLQDQSGPTVQPEGAGLDWETCVQKNRPNRLAIRGPGVVTNIDTLQIVHDTVEVAPSKPSLREEFKKSFKPLIDPMGCSPSGELKTQIRLLQEKFDTRLMEFYTVNAGVRAFNAGVQAARDYDASVHAGSAAPLVSPELADKFKKAWTTIYQGYESKQWAFPYVSPSALVANSAQTLPAMTVSLTQNDVVVVKTPRSMSHAEMVKLSDHVKHIAKRAGAFDAIVVGEGVDIMVKTAAEVAVWTRELLALLQRMRGQPGVSEENLPVVPAAPRAPAAGCIREQCQRCMYRGDTACLRPDRDMYSTVLCPAWVPKGYYDGSYKP